MVTVHETVLSDLRLEYQANFLVLSGTVTNRGSRAVRDLLIGWYAPEGVERLRLDGSSFPGTDAGASIAKIADVLEAGQDHSFSFPVAIHGSLPAQITYSRIGFACEGVSRACPSLSCEIPEDVDLHVDVETPEPLCPGAAGRIRLIVSNRGRSNAGGCHADVTISSALAFYDAAAMGTDARTKAFFVPQIEAGGSIAFDIPVSVLGLEHHDCADCMVSLRYGDQCTSGDFRLPIALAADVQLYVSASDDWRPGERSELRVRAVNAGSGVAPRTEVVFISGGGVSVDTNIADRHVIPSFEDRHRVVRVFLGDLAPDEAVEFVVGVTPPVTRVEDDLRLTAQARWSDRRADCSVPIALEYAAEFSPESGFAQVDGTHYAGGYVRVPLRIVNTGSARAIDVRVALDVDAQLEIVGVEDTRASIIDGVYYAGAIPGGFTHENVLLARVRGAYGGTNDIELRGEVFASNAYGVALRPARICTVGCVAIEMSAQSEADGVVNVIVRSVGDAIAQTMRITCELPQGAAVAERTTRVDGHTLADDGGASVLLQSGISLHDVEPGAQLVITAQVESAQREPVEVAFLASSDETEFARASCMVVPAEAARPALIERPGYRLDHAVLAIDPVWPLRAEIVAVEPPDAPVDDVATDRVSSGSTAARDVERNDGVDVDTKVLSDDREAQDSQSAGGDTERGALELPQGEQQTALVERQEPQIDASAVGEQFSPPLGASDESIVGDTVETHVAQLPVEREREVETQQPSVNGDVAPADESAEERASVGQGAPPADLDRGTVQDVSDGGATVTPITDAIAPKVDAQPLRLVPATLPMSSSWLRGVVTTLTPLIRSGVRELSMHAMAVRLFMPDTIVAQVADGRDVEIAEALTALNRSYRKETIIAAGMAEGASFAPSDAWLRQVESQTLQDAARALVRAVDGARFTAKESAGDASALVVAEIDIQNLGNTDRRFEIGDPLATTWVFSLLFPTSVADAPLLSQALSEYRTAFQERTLWNVPPNLGLRAPVSVELDDALANVQDALRAYARNLGVAVAA